MFTSLVWTVSVLDGNLTDFTLVSFWQLRVMKTIDLIMCALIGGLLVTLA